MHEDFFSETHKKHKSEGSMHCHEELPLNKGSTAQARGHPREPPRGHPATRSSQRPGEATPVQQKGSRVEEPEEPETEGGV